VPIICAALRLVAWHSAKKKVGSLAGELSLSCSLPVAVGGPLVGEPSAINQPTRLTQPFIPLGSIDEQCCNWMYATLVRAGAIW